MLEIDGSHGEGGGQILRTGVVLAALTKTPCTIANIRANRPTPGLKAQHLMGLEAAARICSAETRGLHIGSERVEFIPAEIKSGDYTVEVGTAGAVTLILQVLVPICLHAQDTIILTVTGGTDVTWSPSISYFREIFLYFLRKMNADISCSVEKYGFYPKGGGRVKAVINPWKDKKPLHVTERGSLMGVEVESVAAFSLKKARVAERQSEAFERVFKSATAKNLYVDTLNPGSSLCGTANYEHSRLGADSLGEKGKPAEKVGEEAAFALKKEIESESALDSHMGDQIIPYLALAGGEVSVSRISEHARTNMWVCEQMLDTRLSVSGTKIKASAP